MSKSHPEKSIIYKEKLMIRDKREIERELLKKAKNAYVLVHPEVRLNDLKRGPLRSQIAQLKNKAKRLMLGASPQKKIIEELPGNIEEMLRIILVEKN